LIGSTSPFQGEERGSTPLTRSMKDQEVYKQNNFEWLDGDGQPDGGDYSDDVLGDQEIPEACLALAEKNQVTAK
jgi:hypothetical protein